ncbi:MAG: chemotaxis protein CheW [Desulfobulbales bacterium]|nr:chemotaxis protein CheW [Desulfobulbales bacterium]
MNADQNAYEPDDDLFEDEDTQKDKYLTFSIGSEDYGIAIANVTEIIGIQTITEIPEMPDYIKGVINLRGKVIPIMDVRTRFKLAQREYDARTCIIVVEIDGTSVGLVVDRVSEVADIPEEQVEPPPKTKQKGGNYILGIGKIGKDVKILLDINKILYEDDLEILSEAAQSR